MAEFVGSRPVSGKGRSASGPRLVVTFTPLARERYIYRSESYSHEALKRPLTFPAVVDGFASVEDATFGDYDSLAAGQFAIAGAGGPTARRLRTAELRIFTSDFNAVWLENDLGPDDVHRELTTILRCRKPFKMSAAVYPNPGYGELAMNATVRSVGRELTPGLGNVRYFSASVVEDRKLQIERKGAVQASRARGVKLPTSVTVTEATTLRKLSQRFYGTPNGWRIIAKANNLKIGGDTQIIFAKPRKLRIPEVPTASGSLSEQRRGAAI
jgi:nucleoid-associated protein YgaU